MSKEELTALFCAKVNLEQKRYHRKMLKLKPEDIYDRAYEIGCMVNISEVLLEKSVASSADFLPEIWVPSQDSVGTCPAE